MKHGPERIYPNLNIEIVHPWGLNIPQSILLAGAAHWQCHSSWPLKRSTGPFQQKEHMQYPPNRW